MGEPSNQHESPAADGSARALVLLGAGLVSGVVLAALGIAQSGPSVIPRDAVAVVNGRPISRAAYDRLVAGLAEDKRDPVTAEDRRRVLDRMIEEELLIERALDLDLARNEPRVRGDLAGALIASAVAQANITEPSADDLARFYARNSEAFSAPGQLHVARLFVAAQPIRTPEAAEQRARLAVDRLRAGESFAAVRAALGDRPAAELPEGFLTPVELRRYLGPTAAQTALGLRAREVADPVRSTAGFEVLQLVESRSSAAPAAQEIDDTVRAEWRRRAEEEALRRYLDDLRADATIAVSSSL
jgi:parvulin-like peptidyl-prolyl isomerase